MSDPIIDAVGNTGGVVEIHHKDRVFKLHAWTDKLRAKYTRWVQQHVIAEFRKLKNTLSPEEYREQFAALTKDIVDGEYSFGKPRMNRVTETEQGIKALITILLDDDYLTDEELEDFIVNRQEDIANALRILNGDVDENEGDTDSPKVKK